ncbi:hypothetical protein AN218_13295, partial [Streptomyces nanshensis]
VAVERGRGVTEDGLALAARLAADGVARAVRREAMEHLARGAAAEREAGQVRAAVLRAAHLYASREEAEAAADADARTARRNTAALLLEDRLRALREEERSERASGGRKEMCTAGGGCGREAVARGLCAWHRAEELAAAEGRAGSLQAGGSGLSEASREDRGPRAVGAAVRTPGRLTAVVRRERTGIPDVVAQQLAVIRTVDAGAADRAEEAARALYAPGADQGSGVYRDRVSAASAVYQDVVGRYADVVAAHYEGSAA